MIGHAKKNKQKRQQNKMEIWGWFTYDFIFGVVLLSCFLKPVALFNAP